MVNYVTWYLVWKSNFDTTSLSLNFQHALYFVVRREINDSEDSISHVNNVKCKKSRIFAYHQVFNYSYVSFQLQRRNLNYAVNAIYKKWRLVELLAKFPVCIELRGIRPSEKSSIIIEWQILANTQNDKKMYL